MKTLKFTLATNAPVENIWPIISDINSYHKYIKYCHKSKLIGKFQEGSIWYDWSTVVFLPLKINHKIIKIIPNEKIIYLIKTPLGEIWQTMLIEEGKKTKLKLEVNIDFPNRLIDKAFGHLVYMRNRKMLEATMKNFKDGFSIH